jgi:hypothetical protein
MNERMEKLAIESGVYYHDDMYYDDHASLQRFAELIVEECAQEFDNTYMKGGKTMGAYLREKFGVEE